MVEVINEYIDYIILAIHLLLMVISCVVEACRSRKINSKIEKLCSSCGLPIYTGVEHICLKGIDGEVLSVSASELALAYELYSAIKGGSLNVNG